MNAQQCVPHVKASLTFLLAVLLTLLPLPPFLSALRPQWVMLAVIFWVMAEPYRINVGYAWCVGILLDLVLAAPLGEHALACVVVAYLIARFHRRIKTFTVWHQALIVFIIVFAYQTLQFWLQGLWGGFWALSLYWASALLSAFLWLLINTSYSYEGRQ